MSEEVRGYDPFTPTVRFLPKRKLRPKFAITTSLSAPGVYPEPPVVPRLYVRLAVPNRKVPLAEAFAENLVEEGTTALFELETHCGPAEALVVICRFHWRLKLICAELTWLKLICAVLEAPLVLAP